MTFTNFPTLSGHFLLTQLLNRYFESVKQPVEPVTAEIVVIMRPILNPQMDPDRIERKRVPGMAKVCMKI